MMLTPVSGHAPAFGSGPWLILVLCVVAVVIIFVAVLASGVWRRRRYQPTIHSRRGSG
jgi:hypothetical protein